MLVTKFEGILEHFSLEVHIPNPCYINYIKVNESFGKWI